MKQVLSIVLFIIFGLFFGEVQAQNLLPQANLEISPTRGEVGREIVFDGSASRNAMGDIYGL